MFAISHFSGTEMGLNKINMSSNSSAVCTWVPAKVEGAPSHTCSLLPFGLAVFLCWPLSLMLKFQADFQPSDKKIYSSQGIIYLPSSVASTEGRHLLVLLLFVVFLTWFSPISSSAYLALCRFIGRSLPGFLFRQRWVTLSRDRRDTLFFGRIH